VSAEVKRLLENPCTYEKLLLELEGDQHKMRRIIKWLLDNERIILRVDNLLEWRE
jgi:ATP-dependent DNA helicase RecQ